MIVIHKLVRRDGVVHVSFVVFVVFSADFYMVLILTFTHWLDLNELVLIKCFSTVHESQSSSNMYTIGGIQPPTFQLVPSHFSGHNKLTG